ncbi:MAG: ATP-grasp domain-containing protein [Candidatus Sulfotelmatobacter sp.]
MATGYAVWWKLARDVDMVHGTREFEVMTMAIRQPNTVATVSHPNPRLSSHPTVLVATTSRWFPTARLAMALASNGCVVEMLCPAGHPITKTMAANKIYRYHGLAPLRSFAAAISNARPDLIIPGDDLATRQLHRLYDLEQKRDRSGSSICRLIERSLGPAESFPVAYTRSAFIDLARQEGIRVPATKAIANLDELKDWIIRNGFPVVLKADGTSGGDGVRIVRTLEEAERAFSSLQAPPRLLRAAKRAMIDHDVTLVGPALLRRRFEMNAQAFVEGREATSAVACWRGTVLAALHFEVIKKRSAAGPATVVRWIENTDIATAAEKMVRRLNLSGVHGFDFMLEERTGKTYLIEMNPRATQVGHLALGPGRDIPAALYAALSGTVRQSAPAVTENDTIALFPQEWIRNPESAFLQSAYHDIPWEAPEFVRDCVSNQRKQSAWYSRENWNKSSAPVQTPKKASAAAKAYGVGTRVKSDSIAR